MAIIQKIEKYDKYPYIYHNAWEINHYASSPVPRCCIPSPSQPRLWLTLPISLNLSILNLMFIFLCINHKYSVGCFFMVHSFLEILKDLCAYTCGVHVLCWVRMTTCRSRFSPCTMEIPRDALKSSGLEASAFTPWAIFPGQVQFL